MLTEILPEWMRRRVEQGTAHHDWIAFPQEFLDAIPQQGPPCELCGTPTEKTYIPHSMGPWPKGLIVSTWEMPAYQCLGEVEPCASYEKPTVVYLCKEGTQMMLSLVRKLLDVVEADLEGVSQVDESLRVRSASNEE